MGFSSRRWGRVRRIGAGAGERDGGENVDEFGGQCARQLGRTARRPAGAAGRGAVAGQPGQGPPPGGDAPADQHAEPERERASTFVQGGVTELFVPGVERACVPVGVRGLRVLPVGVRGLRVLPLLEGG
ncbi:hypothetical protein [Rhodococcus jostii]|uniref:hypothetical protein n=1 Tax=Rhodococcus jostii TaxID=132919 RepID=UPI00059F53C9|nr:hypothetical protein [Rhodococcus jostii]